MSEEAKVFVTRIVVKAPTRGCNLRGMAIRRKSERIGAERDRVQIGAGNRDTKPHSADEAHRLADGATWGREAATHSSRGSIPVEVLAASVQRSGAINVTRGRQAMVEQSWLHTHTRRLAPLFVVVWFAALVPAARSLLRYERTAGAMQAAPSQWPGFRSSGLRSSGFKSSGFKSSGATRGSGTAADTMSDPTRANNEGLLIVAVHPLCSCTRATLEELEKSAAGWRQPYHAVLLLYRSTGHPADSPFAQAGYVRDAKQALHADLVSDEGGEQAAHLGALTSGEVLYYSAADKQGQRQLLFSGGVTGGRGMVGENGGIEALEQAVRATSLAGQDSQQTHAPVYGCGLAALSNQDSRDSNRNPKGISANNLAGSSTGSPAE